MPYIEKIQREACNSLLKELLDKICYKTKTGILNYIITKILLKAIGQTPTYSRYNELVGVLECVKMELYRRAIAKYEDKKISENGDVY
jgi:hypothetical protein